MKFKQFTKIVAASSVGSAFCFLASCKDAEKTTDTSDKPAKEAPAKETPAKPVAAANVPIYVVTVSGSG